MKTTAQIVKEYCKVGGYTKIPVKSLSDMELWLIEQLKGKK
jgi:rhamnose utilization protein RhaD (predicted bifunctional aldolase and dehydrogenase)